MHRLLTGPQGQELPVGYRWLVLKGVVDLGPWYMIEGQEQAESYRKEWHCEIAPPNTSPIEDWFPFAHKRVYHEFAGFVIKDGQVTSEVMVIHLTWTHRPELPGYPSMQRFRSIWSWLRAEVVPALGRWVDERQVKKLLEEHAAQ